MIIKGKKYPVLICWAAIAEFCETKGVQDLSAIENLSRLNAKDIQILMFWSLFFGCKSENETFPYTCDELGLIIGPVEVTEFIKEFARQMKSLIPKSDVKNIEDIKKKNRWSWLKSKE